ncbi:MAG: 16S rRNA (guanine(966)-N(2))-methyltransferase RsmD [Kiritimatiellae bacterium]|nr:16S rRNA (guanine(966)-N(2))-methyltransferase RsmD [Kiritimatiellia bacterium]
MRITGGIFGGRNLLVPKSDLIRPTQDRVREALFSILQTELSGAKFLDLFAGSGAVGLEALSRGASAATFVEANKKHAEILRKNIMSFSNVSSRSNVIVKDVYSYVDNFSESDGFDIAFADPPYALGEEKGYARVLDTLKIRGVVRNGGLFIAEMTAVQKAEETPGWELLRDRTYGKTRICIWRRIG